MKFSAVAASLCVLGSASAFVVPMPARSGVATRVSSSPSDDVDARLRAREALMQSAGMDRLMKFVQKKAEDEEEVEATVATSPPPTPPSPPPAEEEN